MKKQRKSVELIVEVKDKISRKQKEGDEERKKREEKGREKRGE